MWGVHVPPDTSAPVEISHRAPRVIRCILFFFSSRRRHTRCSRDWSSDVCSSDLVRPQEVNEAIRPVFDDRDKAAAIDKGRLLARGLPAAPGAAVGKAVFDADRAVEWAHANEKVILVRPETSPEDVAGMYAAEGIVTSRGGRTSHAAVVAVGMGKACVVGAAEIVVDEHRRVFEVGGRIVREGDWISVDGGSGEVLLDTVKTVEIVRAHV